MDLENTGSRNAAPDPAAYVVSGFGTSGSGTRVITNPVLASHERKVR